MTERKIPEHTSPSSQNLVAELRRFANFSDLRHSGFYRAHKAELKHLLDDPRVYTPGGLKPRLRSFLRVVEWNIERGSRLDGIIEVLNSHPALRFADLLLINELDDGMLRSGNLNVALKLSRALETHAVFGVEYLELTKGVGAELSLEGENMAALHGNAILTRHEFSHPEIVRLPRCENNFESREKRLGGRIGILVDLHIGDATLAIGNTHLDVVNSPRCRASQLRAMLKAIEARTQDSNGAAIVGGDLNTHTFARGTRLEAMKNTVRVLTTNRPRLNRRLLNPALKEPAIREFARFGYETEGFNDRNSTSRGIVSNLDDPQDLPRPMKWWVKKRIGPQGLLLEFRLDWLAARGLKALRAGEMVDQQTGVASVDAQTFIGLTHNGLPLSDHDPIVVDVAIP